MAVVMGCLALTVTSAQAQLTAYYTLDDLTTGIQNQGSDGATSNLSVGGDPMVAPGIIGSAIRFDGGNNSATGDILSGSLAGNAAADLSGYPFTVTGWIKSAVDIDGNNSIFVLSDISQGDIHIGVELNGADDDPGILRRNGGGPDRFSSGVDINDGEFHHTAVVFNGNTNAQIYVDGVLAGTETDSVSFNMNIDTLNIGGFLRNSSAITSPTDSLEGDVDDVGLFSSALAAADIALINGLGQVGGIGLDQFDEAQALAMAGVGTEALIGGFEFERVDGLVGITGDFGGTTAGGDAFIIFDDTGSALQQVQVIPEPASLVAWLIAGLVTLGFFYARRKK